MRSIISQISSFLVILTVVSCHRPPEFPVEPQISFERLQLSDTATLVLTFNVRDGDGDIGLDNESVDYTDLFEPYHPYSVATLNDELVTFQDDTEGPYEYVPASLLTIPNPVYLFQGYDNNDQPIYREKTFLELYAVGEPFSLSNDPGKPQEYDCRNYEPITFSSIEQEINDGEVIFESIRTDIDTILVIRNDNYFNLNMNLKVKSGNDFVDFQGVDDCGLGSSARFPVFDRSDFGRPLDGSIQYAFFSILFEPENVQFLSGTYKLEFYITDRALQKSQVVETPEFNFLGLRAKDLTPEGF